MRLALTPNDGGADVSTRQSPPAAGHDWAAELLSALLDGELDETTAAAVTAHRQECAECSRDWAELRATKQLLAALPAAQAPRSYAILADDLAEPDRAGTPFWPRLLGLTWRLSGAVAVVIILIGTLQFAGISLSGEPETQYSQAEPQAASGRLPEQLGASERPAARQAAAPAGAAGAADAASQAIVVERGKPVVVEKVVTVEQPVVVEKVVEKQVVAADAARLTDPGRHAHRRANGQPPHGNDTADRDSRAAAGRAGRPDVCPGGAMADRWRGGGRRGRGGVAGRALGSRARGVTGLTPALFQGEGTWMPACAGMAGGMAPLWSRTRVGIG